LQAEIYPELDKNQQIAAHAWNIPATAVRNPLAFTPPRRYQAELAQAITTIIAAIARFRGSSKDWGFFAQLRFSKARRCKFVRNKRNVASRKRKVKRIPLRIR
jgi:hypothetical protein